MHNGRNEREKKSYRWETKELRFDLPWERKREGNLGSGVEEAKNKSNVLTSTCKTIPYNQ